MNFRILFITQDDPFYVRLFFEEFFKIYKDLDEIVAVVIAQPMGKESLFRLAQQMYNFYGLIDFLRMSSRYAAYRILSITPTFLKTDGFYSIARVCKYYSIEMMHDSNINSNPFLTRVKQMSLDLIISVAAPIIFKQDLIQLPRYGCINIHNGKLPRYRGMLPNFWQMYYDEKTIGITIHEINTEIDEGRIILQKEVDIHSNEVLDSLIKRSKRVGAQFMVEAIKMIKLGKVKHTENITTEGSYFSFPTREDVKEFKRRGKRIL